MKNRRIGSGYLNTGSFQGTMVIKAPEYLREGGLNAGYKRVVNSATSFWIWKLIKSQ